ncbi:putative assembly chaperone of rpl4 [Fulvia fulva]|uniref:Assembly chaperone of rpl4 n=1 Tax=Passalora fulva TaxID=5499 RepID=A0A9Q8L6W8_PASFU|nr:putative assembly chaperone of rpl4 [Fulvia fulva]KAK4634626.1 putative assembly chaperone of rpl4 [Fulvia fulva]KAK4637721.1 putative assembly chaperone of rpl4 [Fulvia fulva]UJO11950.1 putative assembly chaperone of rpl4 [Fulvia fulva]WPV09261.1 putative assembly chaperone of rpl4 [Fulvia fulva]WPV24297.1 putative assembly chaperone of rpl4 [Fulvia fulva]
MARTKYKHSGATREAMASTSPEQLYALALDHVEQSQPAEALLAAKQLWALVKDRPSVNEKLPALNLLGDISIELGAVDSARAYFEQAVKLDPEGQLPEALGGGAEKFLWLAQLCDEGGKQSVEWFEKGAKALQNEIAAIESGQITGLGEEQLLLMRIEKKRKLANALCGIVEVYMTDLSWEDDAEARCESLVTQAMTVEDETSPEVLQTLASVRLSQERKEDAQSALKRSLETWIELESEDEAVPDFPTKISLARLLMEADLFDEAMEVCHRLIQEDDQSVEAWYLGGWCQHLLAERNKASSELVNGSAMDTGVDDQPAAVYHRALKGSRRWLRMAAKLYEQQQYEDDRLFAHAKELVASLDTVLGPEDDQAEDEDEEEWEGIEDGSEDEEMQDS